MPDFRGRSSSHGPASRRILGGRSGRILAVLACSLAIAGWLAAGTMILFFEPTTAQKLAAVAAAAVATEVALWICAAFLGVSVFRWIAKRLGR